MVPAARRLCSLSSPGVVIATWAPHDTTSQCRYQHSLCRDGKEGKTYKDILPMLLYTCTPTYDIADMLQWHRCVKEGAAVGTAAGYSDLEHPHMHDALNHGEVT